MTQPQRFIGRHLADSETTLVFFGGLHGNEPAGVKALERLFLEINKGLLKPQANIYGIYGNLKALKLKKRYIKHDLNRLWTPGRMKLLAEEKLLPEDDDTKEQIEIYKYLNRILNHHKGPFYFIDLHTTSAQTVPFITINDTLLNRKLARFFPLPGILGIEEQLSGTLLSYLNRLGYVALGFESGRHEDALSVENHKTIIDAVLALTAGLPIDSDKIYRKSFEVLRKTHNISSKFFEIKYRHALESITQFEMLEGFENFQKISKNQRLAFQESKWIKASYGGRILMPLYQKYGNDGFFIIQPVSNFILAIAAFFRKIRLDGLLRQFPGIQYSKETQALHLSSSVMRLLPLSFWHLTGYKIQKSKNGAFYAVFREKEAKKTMYRHAPWRKKYIFKNKN